MKIIQNLIILLFLVACAVPRPEWRGTTEGNDVLSDESSWRLLKVSNNLTRDRRASNMCANGNVRTGMGELRKEMMAGTASAATWLSIGNCHYIRKDYRRAQFYYNLAIDESKSSSAKAFAYNNLGLISYRVKDWAGARQYFEKSIDLTPNLKVPRLNLAFMEVYFGLFSKAEDTLSYPALKNSNDVDVNLLWSVIYVYEGKKDLAYNKLNRLPSSWSKSPEVSLLWGLWHWLDNNPAKAKELLKGRRPAQQGEELRGLLEKIDQRLEANRKKK